MNQDTKVTYGYWLFQVRYFGHEVTRARDDFSEFAASHDLGRRLSRPNADVFWARNKPPRLVGFVVDRIANSVRGAIAGPDTFIKAGKEFIASLPVQPLRPI